MSSRTAARKSRDTSTTHEARKTKEIDPLGRETVYVYGNNNVPDANPTTGEGIDLLQVKRKNGGSYDVLASYTYNAQHQPLTITDARGADDHVHLQHRGAGADGHDAASAGTQPGRDDDASPTTRTATSRR